MRNVILNALELCESQSEITEVKGQVVRCRFARNHCKNSLPVLMGPSSDGAWTAGGDRGDGGDGGDGSDDGGRGGGS